MAVSPGAWKPKHRPAGERREAFRGAVTWHPESQKARRSFPNGEREAKEFHAEGTPLPNYSPWTVLGSHGEYRNSPIFHFLQKLPLRTLVPRHPVSLAVQPT